MTIQVNLKEEKNSTLVQVLESITFLNSKVFEELLYNVLELDYSRFLIFGRTFRYK